MYQKNCYKCHRSSFGSDPIGEWLCPICGEDLTAQKGFHPMLMEKVNELNHRREESTYQKKIHTNLLNEKFEKNSIYLTSI